MSQHVNDVLTASYSGDEVWKALETMRDLKAPGADGTPAIFYKRLWHLMGDRVKQEVLSVLNGGDMPERWNDTIIILIPKVKSPE